MTTRIAELQAENSKLIALVDNINENTVDYETSDCGQKEFQVKVIHMKNLNIGTLFFVQKMKKPSGIRIAFLFDNSFPKIRRCFSILLS